MPLCEVELSVGQRGEGRRIDAYLPSRLCRFSRARIQELIGQGLVRVDGRPVKASQRLRAGMRIELRYPAGAYRPLLVADDVPLEVLWEDEWLLALSKPAGMPAQPRHRFEGGTLVNAVIAHLGLSGERGPGLVHRLDTDTSGVVLLGKTPAARAALAAQFKHRTVRKEYRALTDGVPQAAEQRIDLPLGPDPADRRRRVAGVPGALPALTEVRLLERLGSRAWLACRPHTGRTHQIRVHLAAIGCPITGDEWYGRAAPADLPLARQALHAFRLEIEHPATGRPIAFEAPLPEDLRRTLDCLRNYDPGRATAPEDLRRTQDCLREEVV